MIKRFNFKDGSYPYDTKCVSDYIDNKYSIKYGRKKIKISVPNSPRGGGLRVRDNVPKIEYYFFEVFPNPSYLVVVFLKKRTETQSIKFYLLRLAFFLQYFCQWK